MIDTHVAVINHALKIHSTVFVFFIIQWNPSKADTIGTKNVVRCNEVSLAQGLVVDHAPPTITASYDTALLWMTKKTILMRDLSTDSS